MSINSALSANSQLDESLTPIALELLASRICHDLISPVGAINNGIEFLEEMGIEAGQDAIELISYSARQAAAKLQVFRIAYGAGGRDPNIKPEDVHEHFNSMIEAEGKFTQDWDPHGDLGFEDRPNAYCKILMSCLLLIQECLPKGGTIRVGSTQAGETVISGEGEDASPRDGVEQALSGKMSIDDVDPRLVHPYALALLANFYKYGLALESSVSGQVSLTLTLPQ